MKITTKVIDKYISDILPREILVSIILEIMNEYSQVRRQVRLVVKDIITESDLIEFPNKKRRGDV